MDEGSVSVDELEILRKPPSDRPAAGLIVGSVDSAQEDDKVLVSINNRFVSGSPVFMFQEKPNSFLAMLPQGTLLESNSIALFRLSKGQLYRLSTNE